MKDSLLLRRFSLHGCYSFRVLTIVAVAMLLPTASAVAQDAPEEQEKERDEKVRIGVYLSGHGLISNIDLSPLYGGGNIESPEDDIMPYPFTFLSIRINRYEGIVGWRQDYDGKESFKHKHNEHIATFAARYNYYPFKRNLYIYGGPVIWRFEKHFSLERYVCTGDIIGELPGEERCDGETIPVAVRTERPDGKSTTLGINAGFGIEYTLFNLLVFSHEIEFYRSACKRKDFICKGADLKLLGLHLEF